MIEENMEESIQSDENIPPQQTHPLVNPDSNHYRMVGGVEAITLMEQLFTLDELMAWAKLTSYKYRFRLGKKDSDIRDIEKMKTYEDYYAMLRYAKDKRD